MKNHESFCRSTWNQWNQTFLNPSEEADQEYQNSIVATAILIDAIYNQHPKFVVNEEELKIVEDSWGHP